jgi:2-oxoisovalerate dehydrogenase E1 component
MAKKTSPNKTNKSVSNSNFKYDISGLEKSELLNLYVNLLKPRLIEEKMLLLLREQKMHTE